MCEKCDDLEKYPHDRNMGVAVTIGDQTILASIDYSLEGLFRSGPQALTEMLDEAFGSIKSKAEGVLISHMVEYTKGILPPDVVEDLVKLVQEDHAKNCTTCQTRAKVNEN